LLNDHAVGDRDEKACFTSYGARSGRTRTLEFQVMHIVFDPVATSVIREVVIEWLPGRDLLRPSTCEGVTTRKLALPDGYGELLCETNGGSIGRTN
jgi:hypothetical protein